MTFTFFTFNYVLQLQSSIAGNLLPRVSFIRMIEEQGELLMNVIKLCYYHTEYYLIIKPLFYRKS